MNDSARPVAIGAIVLLGGALAAIAYRGMHGGPSASSPSSTESSTGSPPISGSSAAPPAQGSATPPTGPRFVASADLTPEEQLVLERLNQVRANPPAFVDVWRTRLQADVADKLVRCDEPLSMLDPLATFAPRQPLAANQQLTNAARAHARDQIARNFWNHVNPDGIGSNRRIIAAGYPLPIDTRLTPVEPDGSFPVYDRKPDGVSTESLALTVSTGNQPTTFTPHDYWRLVDGLVIDPCVPSRGHRTHVLGASSLGAVELEIGVGGTSSSGPDPAEAGSFKSQLHVVLEIATRNDGNRYVLGVVFRDKNHDGLYDAGEGIADTPVEIAGVSTKTGPGGGYALPVPDGFHGDVSSGEVKVPVAIAGTNVKVDFRLP